MFCPASESHRSPSSFGPARTAMLLAVFALGACGESTTAPAANVAPEVVTLSMAEDGYSKARLTGSAADPDGTIASAVIDWGDGTTTEVTGDVGAISVQHRYDRAQDYTVTLTVTDDQGLTAQRSSSIRIDVPDPVCLDLFKVVAACINGQSNLRNFEAEIRVLNRVVYRSEIRDGQGDVRIPLNGGFGFLRLQFNMDTGRVTISGEVCPVPFLVCEEVVARTIQLQT